MSTRTRSPSPSQLDARKRPKTFTGCFLCRKRKVKCGEERVGLLQSGCMLTPAAMPQLYAPAWASMRIPRRCCWRLLFPHRPRWAKPTGHQARGRRTAARGVNPRTVPLPVGPAADPGPDGGWPPGFRAARRARQVGLCLALADNSPYGTRSDIADTLIGKVSQRPLSASC